MVDSLIAFWTVGIFDVWTSLFVKSCMWSDYCVHYGIVGNAFFASLRFYYFLHCTLSCLVSTNSWMQIVVISSSILVLMDISHNYHFRRWEMASLNIWRIKWLQICFCIFVQKLSGVIKIAFKVTYIYVYYDKYTIILWSCIILIQY